MLVLMLVADFYLQYTYKLAGYWKQSQNVNIPLELRVNSF